MKYSHARSQALSILSQQEVAWVPRRRPYITPVDETTIGRRLREIRQRRGFTQAEIAEHLGIDQTLVSNYERGAARIHGALVAGFAKALRVSADEILGIKNLAGKNHKNGRLVRRLERIQELPAADQRAVLKFLSALLERPGRKTSSQN
jgi:transcriptional regulator with XRE-family HTH domain